MSEPDLFAKRAVVLGSALVYWAGVYLQARRIRRRIKRSPNVKPRGKKERILWAGWVLVVAGWLSMPFLARTGNGPVWLRLVPALEGPVGFFVGCLLVAAGYAGTLWCYAAMGNTWRMGVDRTEKTPLVTNGPYRFVRHPIYLTQALMLVGAFLLLPSALSFVVLGVHVACILAKAADEESFLRAVHEEEYLNYLSRSGRFLPRLKCKSK